MRYFTSLNEFTTILDLILHGVTLVVELVYEIRKWWKSHSHNIDNKEDNYDK